MLISGIALPLCIILRFLQLYTAVELKTGFYLQGKEAIGTALMWGILITALALFAACLFLREKSNRLPAGNVSTTIISLGLGAALFYETMFTLSPTQITDWQLLLLRCFGILAVIFFIFYAMQPIWKLNIPRIMYAIPTMYMIVRIICDFTVISKLALISDNVLLIAAYCTVLIFFLIFSKLYNGIYPKNGDRKLLALGNVSVILCFTAAAPNLCVHLLSENGYLHTSVATDISLMFIGLFILSFTLSRFKKDN